MDANVDSKVLHWFKKGIFSYFSFEEDTVLANANESADNLNN